MFDWNWLKVCGATRGTPRRGHARRGRLAALALIAGLVLVQAGCRSGGCGRCKLFSPCGFLGRATSRVLNRPNGDCCGSSVMTDAPVLEYGAPSTVVVPPAGAPLYTPGPGVTTSPSTGLPPPEVPSELEAIPKARPGPTPSGTSSGSGSGAGRTSYSTARARTSTAGRRPDDLGRALGSTPDSSRRSARARPDSPAAMAPAAHPADPLDHLPPLDLPGEVTRSTTTPPTPPAAAREEDRTEKPGRPEAARGADGPVSLTLGTATGPTHDPAPAAAAGQGIDRFTPVDLRIAGGSLPSSTGLSWLADKGYRTLLDLRDAAEISPAFMAEVTRCGLRYIALPIDGQPIDRQILARFHYEISAAEARPLYFFDRDGSRAGALWYLRRVTVDRVDQPIARREAEDLGLVKPADWLATTACLEKLNATPTSSGLTGPSPAAPPDSPPVPTSAGGPATSPPASAERDRADSVPATLEPHAPAPTPEIARPSSPAPTPASASSSLPSPPALATSSSPTTAPLKRTSSDRPAAPDSGVWRPYAALLLTGLSLPLAYWTRTLIPAALEKARASLPAPGPRPKPLSHESGG